MICSNPITIRNRKKHFIEGYDKPFVKCSCGRCNSCKITNQNDWFLRSLYHYKDFVHERGGIVVYITLTFNDENLPFYHNGRVVYGIQNTIYPTWKVTRPKFSHVDVSSGEIIYKTHVKYKEDFTFPVFSKPKLDTYINTVKKIFKRHYDIDGIDYIFCSEKGGKTNRPHLHGLWFIPDVVKVKDKESVSHYRSVILDILRRSWAGYYNNKRDFKKGNGYVFYSKAEKGGPIVNNQRAIDYVSKYISKDYVFYEDNTVKDALKRPYICEILKKHLPKHYQSKGLGAKLCDVVVNSSDIVDILSNGIKVPRKKDKANSVRQPLPQYILRKLMTESTRNIDIEPRQKITPYASLDAIYHKFEYFKQDFMIPTSLNIWYNDLNFDKVIEICKDSLDRFFTLDGLNSFFNSESHVYNFCKAFVRPLKDRTLPSLLMYLRDKLHGYTVRDLAVYKQVYYLMQHNDDLFHLNINGDIVTQLVLNAHDVVMKRLRFKRYFDYSLPEISNGCNNKLLYSSLFSVCYDFEEILDIIAKIQAGFSFGKSASYMVKYRLMRNLKNKVLT